MNSTIALFLVIFLSYLIGSIPSAVIISKIFFGFDIRKKGSKNMGSTNAFRVLGKKWGIIVQIADILKGVIAVLLISHIFNVNYHFASNYLEDTTIVGIIAGISAVLGHIFSLFVKFRGGKGINTALGMLLAVAPVDVSIALGIFIIAVIFSGYISLGSILAAVTLPSSLFVRYNIFSIKIPAYSTIIYFSLALSLLLIFAHRSNIKRLIAGTENKFSKLKLIKFNRNI